jgi:hypothetical protein
MRRRAGVAVIMTALLALAGCSTAPIDPALTSAVADSISAGASAQLGLELSGKSRILPGTLTTLLGDMQRNLLDSERRLEIHQPADPGDAAYRTKALTEVRDSLEAIHVAQSGDQAAGLDALSESVDALRKLEASG